MKNFRFVFVIDWPCVRLSHTYSRRFPIHTHTLSIFIDTFYMCFEWSTTIMYFCQFVCTICLFLWTDSAFNGAVATIIIAQPLVGRYWINRFAFSFFVSCSFFAQSDVHHVFYICFKSRRSKLHKKYIECPTQCIVPLESHLNEQYAQKYRSTTVK